MFVAVFLLGTSIGSFLNVVSLRFGVSSFVTGSSECPKCKKGLRWIELIPVLSFIFLKGQCRGCGLKISWQYPLVEVATGVLFLLLFLFQKSAFQIDYLHQMISVDFILTTILLWISWSFLIVIFIYDLYHKIIPDRLVFLFTIFSLFIFATPLFIESEFLFQGSFVDIMAGPLMFFFFFFFWFISGGRWMGLGDAKLALGLGFLLGFVQGISALVLSFWIGAFIALLILLFIRLQVMFGVDKQLPEQQKRLTIKSEIPFAPFLILGALIAYFFSLDLMNLSILFGA